MPQYFHDSEKSQVIALNSLFAIPKRCPKKTPLIETVLDKSSQRLSRGLTSVVD